MRTVSGYDLQGWIARWQDYLKKLPRDAPPAAGKDARDEDLLRALTADRMRIDARSRAREVRTAELLFARGAPGLAAERFRAPSRVSPTIRVYGGISVEA